MRRIMHVLLVLVCAVGAVLWASNPALAAYNGKPVVVSLGDSYASGEGIEPYYGQDSSNKYYNQDWVAHRSSNSWSANLRFGGATLDSMRAVPTSEPQRIDETISYAGDLLDDNITTKYSMYYDYTQFSDGTWFNVTSSASYINHIYGISNPVNHGIQKKTIQTSSTYFVSSDFYTAKMAPQITVFDYINEHLGKGTVDLVTITSGGNDLNIATNIIQTAISSSGNTTEQLRASFENSKKLFNTSVRASYIQMLKDVQAAAGSQAKIILVGYPLTFDGASSSAIGSTLNFSKEDMKVVDDFIRWFDEEMVKVVLGLNADGYTNIHYVSLVDPFTGHGAYSQDSYVYSFVIPARTQDVNKNGILALVSLASLHPNEKGSALITNLVQNLIYELRQVDSGSKAHVSGWGYADGQTHYYDANGQPRKNYWLSFDGCWYYFDAEGNLAKNCVLAINGARYAFNASGKMLTDGWVQQNGKYYFAGSDGAIVVNDWVRWNGITYFAGADGSIVGNDWFVKDGKRYFARANGTLVKSDWIYVGGKYYYASADGSIVVNDWVLYKGRYYYFGSDGVCVSNGWVNYKGDYYYMDAQGHALSNTWHVYNGKYYYFDGSGKLVVNDWVLYKGKYYYMDENANPVVNAWIEYNGTRYYFNGSGVCTKSQKI